MHLEKRFEVSCPPDAAAQRVCGDEALLALFPAARVEIVARDGDRRTIRTHYTALGRSGTATFHFHFHGDGGISFEKVCDGRVWQELRGSVRFALRRGGARVTIETEGRTRAFVPEIAIRGAMRDQLEQMAAALRERIEGGA